MSAGPLVVEIICTCCLAAFLLHRYGDLRKQNILTTLTTFISWYFSFLIIFVLPLDVSSVSKLFNLLVIFIHKSIWFFFFKLTYNEQLFDYLLHFFGLKIKKNNNWPIKYYKIKMIFLYYVSFNVILCCFFYCRHFTGNAYKTKPQRF